MGETQATVLLDSVATPLHAPPRLWWGSQETGGYDTGNLGRTHRILRAGQVPAGRPVPASVQRFAAGCVVASAAPDLREWWRAAGVDRVVVPIFFHRGHLFVGPRLDRASGLCPTCLALRLGQAAPHPDVYRAVLEGQACSSDRTGARLLEGFLDAAVARLDPQIRAAAHSPGHCFTLAAEGRGWQRRSVVAPPGHHPDHDCRPWVAALIPHRPAWATTRPARRLPVPPLDPLVGPLLRTAAVPIGHDAPAKLAAFATTAGFLGRMTRWQSDVTGSGVGFDVGAARGASIGEAVERYCGNFVPADRLRLASEGELTAAGEPFLGHAAFGANQRYPGPAAGRFRPHRSDEAEYWIAATRLGEPEAPATLLPAEAVVLNFTRYSRRGALFPAVLAGIAAGTGPASAALAATLELVEGDAAMVWWYGGRPAVRITDLPAAIADRVGSGGTDDRDVDLWFLRLPSAVPVRVVAACLHDRRHDILVTGYAARGDAASAVAKAAAEAWQLRQLSRLLLDADGPLWPEVIAGRFPLPVVDHRPDRSYADAFRIDGADLHQLAFHLQYFLDPRTHPAALARLRPEGTVPFSRLAAGDAAPLDLDAVVGACRGASVPLWSVDLTTPDMAASGYSVQRVVAPALAGNTPAAFVPFWHPRLAPTPGGGPLHRTPMPHA